MIDLNELNKAVAPLRKKATLGIVAQIGFGIFFILGMLNLYNSKPGSGSGLIPFFVIAVIAFMIVASWSNKAKKTYATEVKLILSDKLFRPHFENYSFDPNAGFSYQTVNDLDIFPRGDSYTSNDLMSGTLHSVQFSRADVHTTTTTTDSEGSSHTTTNFKGQVYAFYFFKNSNSYLRIRDRSFSKFGRGRKVDGASHIKFEDSAFNDMFRCYSNNDHEAYYLFTPHFMQKMMDFRRKLNMQFSLVIHNSMLYIAIYSNKDSFEPNVIGGIDHSYIDEVNADLAIITTIIDDLDLKNTLFK